MSFEALGVKDEIVDNLAERGITHPTPVQVESIPPGLEGRDLLVESETGSGKTIAFGIPIVQGVTHEEGKIQAIVLCPTRELAKQVAGEFEKFRAGLKVLTVYGGVSYEPQKAALPTTDIVVGTPGRVLDLMEQGALRLEHIRFLVLDEADRMLDMGFIEDIERILAATPASRQTLLFSATVSYRIQHLSEQYMRDPLLIRVESQEVRGHLFQGYYVCHPWQKIGLLAKLIKEQDRVLVFCRTIVATDHVAAELRKRGIKARSINGNMGQASRERTVKEFQEHKFSVLVATDVAARGLHIEGITHVYNYDLPDEAETYVHRVGRTARQGADGDAITLLSEDDYRKFDPIMDLYDDEIEKLTYHAWGTIERIPPSPPRKRDARRGPRRSSPGRRARGRR